MSGDLCTGELPIALRQRCSMQERWKTVGYKFLNAKSLYFIMLFCFARIMSFCFACIISFCLVLLSVRASVTSLPSSVM